MIDALVKKSYSFSLVAMNEDKKQVLIDKAQAILDLKNEVSVWICENFLKFTHMNKFDMIKEFTNINPLISTHSYQVKTSNMLSTVDSTMYIQNTKTK
jgi:hypothetical protein